MLAFLIGMLISSASAQSICSDGWLSPSSGRGTCSHHGGVSSGDYTIPRLNIPYIPPVPTCGYGEILRWNTCHKVYVPNNASFDKTQFDGWSCNFGYRRNGNACEEIPIPQNSFRNQSSSVGWTCYDGYIERGSLCVKVNVPLNATLSKKDPDGWTCNYGYLKKKEENICIKINVPNNATLSAESANGWECNYGYLSGGNFCYEVVIPKNAIFSKHSPSGWLCKQGYTLKKRGCIKNPQYIFVGDGSRSGSNRSPSLALDLTSGISTGNIVDLKRGSNEGGSYRPGRTESCPKCLVLTPDGAMIPNLSVSLMGGLNNFEIGLNSKFSLTGNRGEEPSQSAYRRLILNSTYNFEYGRGFQHSEKRYVESASSQVSVGVSSRIWFIRGGIIDPFISGSVSMDIITSPAWKAHYDAVTLQEIGEKADGGFVISANAGFGFSFMVTQIFRPTFGLDFEVPIGMRVGTRRYLTDSSGSVLIPADSIEQHEWYSFRENMGIHPYVGFQVKIF